MGVNHDELIRTVLHELADDLPPAHPPAGLWRRARRERLRDRAAVVVVGCCLLIGAGLVAGIPASVTVSPAGPPPVSQEQLRMPDRVYAPSPWLAGTDQTGPPGPLALIGSAERARWLFGRRRAPVGISAVDGSYRFLDLPDRRDEHTTVALSPDGLRVAYYLSGSPESPDAQSDLVGVGVYDVMTGEVTRHEVETTYGLSEGQVLLWSADGNWLAVEYGQYTSSPGMSRGYKFLSWNPSTDGMRQLGGVRGTEDVGVAPDGFLVGSSNWRVVSPEGEVLGKLRLDREVHWAPWISPDGKWLAAVAAAPTRRGTTTMRLYAGSLSGRGEVTLELVSERWQSQPVWGWLDDERVLVWGYDEQGEHGQQLVSMNLRTGEVVEQFARSEHPESTLGLESVARDLLRQPFVEGVRPSSVPSHATMGAVMLIATVLVAGVLLVRRRLRRVQGR